MEPRTAYVVQATVRRRGAIGWPFKVTVRLELPPNASRESVVDAWFAAYGETFETFHVDAWAEGGES